MHFTRSRSYLLFKMVAVTATAVAIFFCTSLRGLNPNHLTLATGDPARDAAEESEWERSFIHAQIPVHLVQPEWLGRQPHLFWVWMLAETLARAAVIGVLWIASLSLVILFHKKREGNNQTLWSYLKDPV